ncbi:MAG: YbcC family protein [Candidatus Gracilibacteria bacterium]
MSQLSKSHASFQEEHVLHELEHYLPSQGPLKDFVHHNSLHAFQNMKFYDAIFKASEIFGYQTTFSVTEYRKLYEINRIDPQILQRVIKERKGEAGLEEWMKKAVTSSYDWSVTSRIGRLRKEWKRLYPIDLDNTVHPLFFRILCSYLDQGIAIFPFPFEQKGLLNAIRTLEEKSMVSFFKTTRARDLLMDPNTTMSSLLELLVGKEELFEEYLYDQQFVHRGWSGIAATLAAHPEGLLYPKSISLKDCIILELLLEIDALDKTLHGKWKPLGEVSDLKPIDIFEDTEKNEIHEVLKIWQDAFEWSYYDKVLAGLSLSAGQRVNVQEKKSEFQAIFCIDEREDSLRRYLEEVEPGAATLGAPGFFGVEFYFHPAHAKFYEKLCPAPVTPKYLIKEVEKGDAHKRAVEVMYTKNSHTFFRGFFSSYVLGLPALGKLFFNLLHPTMSPAIADAFAHMDHHAELTIVHTGERDEERDLQVGFTVVEMADRVEKLLRNIGLTKDFADFVYIVAHGSSSANNPHHGAHDCGACSGRPGAVNSRVFAFMANYGPVRTLLAERGVTIPEGTRFIGALHDTASDLIAFFDDEQLPEELTLKHMKNKVSFENALDLNSKERSRRFMSIDTTLPLKKIREAIQRRSVSYFEPRPELGHGTNALCIIGNRSFTKQLFLDRRAFLNSYDYRSDPEGKLLVGVITPLAVVCGGINLEYYFSRMDNYKLGAGTKLPHNVMGLIGVANSSDGDLRPGLPLQMIEVHDPIRLMMIVEQMPEVVLSVISSSPALYEWFINEWVHLTVYHPEEKRFYRFKEGVFVPYEILDNEVAEVCDVSKMIESCIKMKTNYILDATKENLPVHILKK